MAQAILSYFEIAGENIEIEDSENIIKKLMQINQDKLMIMPFKPGTKCKIISGDTVIHFLSILESFRTSSIFESLNPLPYSESPKTLLVIFLPSEIETIILPDILPVSISTLYFTALISSSPNVLL